MTAMHNLKPRELEAVSWLCKGMANKEIAREMGLHLDTVESYLQIARRLVGVRNRVELALWAQRNGVGQ